MSTSAERIYIPINKRPAEDRPREKLWKNGAETLSSAELLGILVRQGAKHRSALQVAEDLLSGIEDGLHGLEARHPMELLKVKGIGRANGAHILAALEIARRLRAPQRQGTVTCLETIDDVAEHFRARYGAGAPEKFVAFFINRQHRLLGEMLVAQGGGNAVVVDPKRVYREALLCEAKALILAHNHPGDGLEPSADDKKLTEQLQQAGSTFAIQVAQHVIVTRDSAAGIL